MHPASRGPRAIARALVRFAALLVGGGCRDGGAMSPPANARQPTPVRSLLAKLVIGASIVVALAEFATAHLARRRRLEQARRAGRAERT
jgi:hypothetical protein